MVLYYLTLLSQLTKVLKTVLSKFSTLISFYRFLSRRRYAGLWVTFCLLPYCHFIHVWLIDYFVRIWETAFCNKQ